MPSISLLNRMNLLYYWYWISYCCCSSLPLSFFVLLVIGAAVTHCHHCLHTVGHSHCWSSSPWLSFAIVAAVVVVAINRGCHCTVSPRGTWFITAPVVGIAIIVVQSCGPDICLSVIRDNQKHVSEKKESENRPRRNFNYKVRPQIPLQRTAQRIFGHCTVLWSFFNDR